VVRVQVPLWEAVTLRKLVRDAPVAEGLHDRPTCLDCGDPAAVAVAVAVAAAVAVTVSDGERAAAGDRRAHSFHRHCGTFCHIKERKKETTAIYSVSQLDQCC